VADYVVPPQWQCLNEEDLRGSVVVLGASDTGKSTLAQHLFREMCRRGVRAAYLDTDMGQSTLGLPTTLNVVLADSQVDDCFPPRGAQAAYFVGATTPRGHMLPTVVGAYRLQQKALALGAQAIVVDTTGLVDRTQGGKALKQWKIELLAPSLVIGLQRTRELEPILWPLRREGRCRCVELAVSPHVMSRSREARIARRRERLASYFAGAQSRSLTLREWAIYDLERLSPGTLLALQDAEGFAVGLGVVQETDRLGGTALVRTPLPSLEGIVSVRLGAARWDLANRREM
jgi:polynucleotide 5'-hydroxyl-kinase GRC3/NOL9